MSFPIHALPRFVFRSPRTAERIGTALALAAVGWHLLLVLYYAFFHFGAPERHILIALEMPFLHDLYGFLARHFVALSATVAPLLGCALFALGRHGSRRSARWLPLAAAVLHLAHAATMGAPLQLAAVSKTLWIDCILLFSAILYLLPPPMVVRAASFEPRPVVRALALTAAGVAAFYGLRELAAEPWWSDFPARLAYVTLAGVGIALLRGLFLEPLLGSRRVSAVLKLAAFWLLADFLLARVLVRVLAVHVEGIYPFLGATEVSMGLFFDRFAIWAGGALLVIDLLALRWFAGRPRFAGREFSVVDAAALLPLVLAERMLLVSLPRGARFLLAWSVTYLPLAAVLWIEFEGGFFFFLLGPLVPALGILLWSIFVSQAVFVLGRRSAEGGRAMLRGGLVVLAAAAVLVAPSFTSPPRWQGLFREYGAVERMAQFLLGPFGSPPERPYRDRIARARRLDHSYEVTVGDSGMCKGFNVVLLTSDALRAKNLGCYGYERETSPNIDNLASESLLFANAFTSASHTFTSVRSFLRGDLTDEIMKDMEGTWLKALVENGIFESATIYNTNMLHLPHASGVEGIRFVPEFELEERERFAADIRAVSEKPFFLWVHNKGTHMRYYYRASSPYFGPWLLDLYDNNVHHFDGFVGYTLELLEELQLRDRTVVVISSDHGEHFNEHGLWGHTCATFYDEVIRVPLIVRVPGGREGVHEGLTTLTDLGVTLVELLGCEIRPIPDWVVSQRPAFEGRRTPSELRVVPLTSIYHHSVGILRSDGLKYFITAEAEYLLDHRIDPTERRNLLELHPELAREGRTICQEFFGLEEAVELSRDRRGKIR